MIKNLLNADEEPPPGTKVVIEDSVVDPAAETPSAEETVVSENAETPETRQSFEIPEEAQFFTKPAESGTETAETEDFADLLAELESFEAEDLKPEDVRSEAPSPVAESLVEEKPDYPPLSGTLFQSEVKPQSMGETIRQSGLAYSAAIVLFGSVVFTMILGWFADLLLGSSPWGIVGGIVLGGIIGFIQFFRITSQIFKK